MTFLFKTLFGPCRGGGLTLYLVLMKAWIGIAATAGMLLGQPALAQTHVHRQMHPNPAGRLDADPFLGIPPVAMVPLQGSLIQAYPTIGVNADGSDLWPCFGRSTPNVDCPSVGNPPLPLPRGAQVTGIPRHTWALRNDDIFGFGLGNGVGCDAFINGTTGITAAEYKPCAQIITFFEDDTNDANDDLVERVVVTQGLNVVYDSGLVNFGPAGPSVTYPVDVLLFYDANFGFWPGEKHGPNNGNCSADIGYPLAAPTFPGVPYQVATDSTCHRPESGKARVHTETFLGTPSFRQVTGHKCTAHNVASPCYTVSWEQKFHFEQDWDIFFR
jgi:hypothetical protein